MANTQFENTATLPRRLSASWRGLSTFQFLAIVGMAGGGWLVAIHAPEQMLAAGGMTVAVAFVVSAFFRLVLIFASQRAPMSAPVPEIWPRYSIVCALYDEGKVVGQLIRALSRIDYPSDRLQGLLVLEARDEATRAAALAVPRPDWLEILIVPPGQPQTKPRALNEALRHVTGDLLTIYDAEDRPDPLQLREAAARFCGDGTGRLGCLQAPLRIGRGHLAPDRSPFIDRQFAAEYAALFEAVLPGLASLGLPFPLGGTSNHFRVDVLRRLGGWDAYNVTEDADLGFRLWAAGYRLGTLSRPTRETPPGPLADWLPQRTRWLKGYMQTFGVHSRRPWTLGLRGLAAFAFTVGGGLASAALHGPSLLWVVAAVMLGGAAGMPPALPVAGLFVLAFGVLVAWLTCAIGARRAGIPYDLRDMVQAPFYWAMLSLAFGHAFWRLLVQPFAWDKTAHRADTPDGYPDPLETMLDGKAPDSLSAGYVAAPEPVA